MDIKKLIVKNMLCFMINKSSKKKKKKDVPSVFNSDHNHCLMGSIIKFDQMNFVNNASFRFLN